MRVASIFMAMVLVLFGILVGVRALGSSGSKVAQAIEPATADGKAPVVIKKGEPAEADILFNRPVEVEEVLRVVGEENQDNLSTMEGSFQAGGEEISDSFSVPPRLETAQEIERAWARARTSSLVDMSQMSDPGVRKILVTKVSLEGNSLELLPARRSDAIKKISVITRSDLVKMFERARKGAKRKGEPPPKFDLAGALRERTFGFRICAKIS